MAEGDYDNESHALLLVDTEASWRGVLNPIPYGSWGSIWGFCIDTETNSFSLLFSGTKSGPLL